MGLEKVVSNDIEPKDDLIALEEIIYKLKGIELSDKPEEDYMEYMKEEFVQGLIERFSKAFISDQSVYSILQILAEIAKTDHGRSLCTKDVILKHLCSDLTHSCGGEAANVSFQACRVLGNICYDSEEARQLAMDSGCHKSLLQLINQLCDNIEKSHPTTLPNKPPSPTDPATTFLHQHLKTAASALINLLYDHTDIQEAVISTGDLMGVVARMMSHPVSSDVLAECCFSLIEFYSLPTPELKTFITSSHTHNLLLDLLKRTQQQHIIDSLFHNLATFAEDNDVKLSLCRSGFVERLLALMEQWREDDGGKKESEELGDGDGVKVVEGLGEGVKDEEGWGDGGGLKVGELVNDFIVLLLTGDESMGVLFEGGEGATYQCIRAWLSPSKSLKLQTASVFAMCNFARSDENCKELIKSGLVVELLSLLQQHPVTTPHHLLQHAIFGSFVNLAISPSNRGGLQGVVNACLSFTNTPSPTILFKMLACVRMMASKNESVVKQVVCDASFMKLLDQSTTHDHKGIMSEALRLYACLTRSTAEEASLSAIVAFNGLKNVLRLFDCEHFIMKNEAVLAFIHLILHKAADDTQLEPFTQDILDKVQRILLPELLSTPPELSNTDSSPLSLSSPPQSSLSATNQPVEVVCNTLGLVILSKNIPCLSDAFTLADLYKRTREHYLNHKDERVTKALEDV